jgi:hypothetical protein
VIIIGGFILGAVIGAVLALRRGGRKLDAAHYAAAFGIIFALIGLFMDIYLGHMI